MAAQPSEQRDEGMGAVEHPQLALLPRLDIVHEPCAGRLPVRPAGGELAAQHPVREGFGDDGGFVDPSGHRAQGLPVGIGHPRGDAIDGCRNQAHPVGQPGGHRGRCALGELSERGPDHTAVVGDVVARDDRERWRTGAATVVERQRDAAERGRRGALAAAQQRDVVPHVGIVGVEPPVAVEPIARLGDGEREDDHIGIREGRDERGDVVARRHPHDARHDLRVVAVRAALDQCVEAVLRCEPLDEVGGATGERGDAPIGGIRRPRGVPGLMGAMERAEAEVHDPHGWRRRAGGGGFAGEADGRFGHSLNAFRGIASTRSSAMRSATGRAMRPSATYRARNAASTRLAVSWRAGIDANARVSSMNPAPR